MERACQHAEMFSRPASSKPQTSSLTVRLAAVNTRRALRARPAVMARPAPAAAPISYGSALVEDNKVFYIQKGFRTKKDGTQKPVKVPVRFFSAAMICGPARGPIVSAAAIFTATNRSQTVKDSRSTRRLTLAAAVAEIHRISGPAAAAQAQAAFAEILLA